MALKSDDEQKFERAEEEKDEVEAHKYEMTDEPKADDEPDDEVEAHKYA